MSIVKGIKLNVIGLTGELFQLPDNSRAQRDLWLLRHRHFYE